jgi:hypothetical protein
MILLPNSKSPSVNLFRSPESGGSSPEKKIPLGGYLLHLSRDGYKRKSSVLYGRKEKLWGGFSKYFPNELEQ